VGEVWVFLFRDHFTIYYRRNVNHSSSRKANQNSKRHIGFHYRPEMGPGCPRC